MENIQELIEELNEILLTDQYTYIGKLGSGGFGSVVMAQSKESDQIVAIKVQNYFKKIVSRNKNKSQEEEALLMEQCHHQNIVKFHKLLFTRTHMFLIMEYLQGSTLDELFVHPISEQKIRKMMVQILSGIECLHSQGIIHRDLKPKNIMLVKENKQDVLKLIDLGLGYKMTYYNQTHQLCGTMLYMAPEMASEKQYNQSVDIFSIGIIFYQLFNQGKHPLFNGMSKDEYLRRLQTLDFQVRYSEEMPPMARDFVEKTIRLNPQDRMTVHQCICHPFIKNQVQSVYPITTNEVIASFNLKQRFVKIIQALLVLSLIKKHSIRRTQTEPVDFSDEYVIPQFLGQLGQLGQLNSVSQVNKSKKPPRYSLVSKKPIKEAMESYNTPQMNKRPLNRSVIASQYDRFKKISQSQSFIGKDQLSSGSRSPKNSHSPSPGFQQTKSKFFFTKKV